MGFLGCFENGGGVNHTRNYSNVFVITIFSCNKKKGNGFVFVFFDLFEICFFDQVLIFKTTIAMALK